MPSYTFTENTTSQNTSDTPTAGTTEDTRLLEVDPTTNYGSNTVLAVGAFATSGDDQVTIFRFDTSSIPDSETVTSVNLYVYQTSFGGPSTTRSLAFHDTLQTAWTEAGATWDDYDGTNPWNIGGAQGDGTDRETTPFLQDTIGNTTGQYYSFTLSTGIVSLTGNTEFGVYLDEAKGSGKLTVWASSEGSDGQRPELEVITSIGGTPTIPVLLNNHRNQGIL